MIEPKTDWWLRRVLEFKIAITLLGWAGPMLLATADISRCLGITPPEPIYFMRLLGWAYLALVVGYTGGYLQLRRGAVPWPTIWMGLVSNGGAAVLITMLVLLPGGAGLTETGQAIFTLSVAVLSLITAGLAVCAWRLKP